MKAELKQRWVRALRSGKYEQTIGRLRGKRFAPGAEDGYCCLGVLLDIVKPDGWTTNQNGTPVHNNASHSRMTGTFNQYINPSLAHSLGLPAGLQKTLARLNDQRQGFAPIADYIEANLRTED